MYVASIHQSYIDDLMKHDEPNYIIKSLISKLTDKQSHEKINTVNIEEVKNFGIHQILFHNKDEKNFIHEIAGNPSKLKDFEKYLLNYKGKLLKL